MTDGVATAEETHAPTGAPPAWFEYGRALLVRRGAVLAAQGEEGTSDTAAHDESVAAAQTAFIDSLAEDRPFSIISANARLTVEHAEVLAVVAAAELDPSCLQLLCELQGDPNRRRATLGTITQLLGPDHLGPVAAAHGSPLRDAGLIDLIVDGPWVDHVIAVHAGVIWALIGDASRDPDLPADTAVLDADEWIPEPTGALAEPDRRDFVIVNGDDRMRRRQFGCAASTSERFLCCTAPDGDAAWAALVREATISGRGVLIEVTESLPAVGRRWIERAGHLSWVLSARSGPPVEALPERARLEITAPLTEPTDDEWAAALGDDVERTHHLTFDQLHRVARARQAAGGDVDSAVRRLASGQLDQLTRRIPPRRTWDDIVLSPDRLDLLHSIVERYRHASQVFDEWGFEPTPSRGLVALFSGPSGTGKTLAAEIIAGALGLDVFKLDLSAVVSKYIGETEKNLEQVFDAASAGNMVLFFDEADSLFGKRSEVKDARDRYANIEVSYLLQRLEAYDGLVIMATNFEKNVDSAFLRRIHLRVAFALPGAVVRAAIWRRNLPATAPVGAVDVEGLAVRFELSGGSIRNATVQAAFQAAAAGTEITMKTAVMGVAREYRKLGRLVKEQDFGEHYDDVAE